MSFTTANFVRIFKTIAPHHHRYEVFRDFVTMSAYSLQNAVHFDQAIEDEYLQLASKYNKADLIGISNLLAEVVMGLERQIGDYLGSTFMSLELGSDHIGQFFTPYEVSRMMAKVTAGEDIAMPSGQDFITVSEPACGAGGMAIAFTEAFRESGFNPQTQLWASCWDIDPVAAKMCYIQLSLLHIPAEVVIGNTLSGKVRQVMYTPAHYFGLWDLKLHKQEGPNTCSAEKQTSVLQTVV
jgi:type I restriction-modification system DNA methylase subunit